MPVRPTRAKGEPRFPGGPAADPAGSHHERRIRSFQPRRSRVTTGQGERCSGCGRSGAWTSTGSASSTSTRCSATDLPVVLEIGFGMGEATAQMAAADPGTGILAVDVHTPGPGQPARPRGAERTVQHPGRQRRRDHPAPRDARRPDSLAGLRVYFPDPWPKKRHHKRRLIQPEFLDLAATRLQPGAILHCATDWEPYAEQMLDVLSAHPDFENTQADGGFAPRPAFRPLTRFEGQGLDKGHKVHDLLFRRVTEHRRPTLGSVPCTIARSSVPPR